MRCRTCEHLLTYTMFYDSKLLPTKLRPHFKKIIEEGSSQVIPVLLVCDYPPGHLHEFVRYTSTSSPSVVSKSSSVTSVTCQISLGCSTLIIVVVLLCCGVVVINDVYGLDANPANRATGHPSPVPC